MKKHLALALGLALALLGACQNHDKDGATRRPPPPPAQQSPANTSYDLLRVFPDHRFEQPVAMIQTPADPDHFYVVEQRGRVWRVGERKSLFLDLHQRVESGGEKGLLGMAFHPDYARNGWFYLSYTALEQGQLTSFVTRMYARNHKPNPATETILISVSQPYGNHNGGQITFGPDGHLYIGWGDGGAGGDPHGHAQNTDSLLGKMLRLNIDGGDPYAIPPDNPFANGGGRAEIYAWGLRNPWRWSFDRENGRLWLADVGQNAWEEIDIIEAGGNYGWNYREGSNCYEEIHCQQSGLIDPVHEYSHDFGRAITGGYVYRGKELPALTGQYLFADFISGNLWSLKQVSGIYVANLRLETGRNIASFAEGLDGEIYVLDYNGEILRLVAAP